MVFRRNLEQGRERLVVLVDFAPYSVGDLQRFVTQRRQQGVGEVRPLHVG